QVTHRKRTAQELLLELVTQHDVQGIRELVRVYTNQTAPHTREVRIDVVDVPFRPADAEVFRDERLHVTHEGAAAADDHLGEQRLTLLQGHAASAANGLVTPVLRQAEVIHRVAGLVQGSEQAREEVV